MKLIQIRGCNGSGKTTMMKQFVEKHNLEIKEIQVNKIPTFISVSKDMQIIVLGRYDKKTGGCDLYKNKEHVYQTIYQVIRVYKPRLLLFEGLIYGLTYKFGKVLADEVNRFGYDYKGVCLFIEPTEAIARIYVRNGGKDINAQYIYNKTKAFLNSYNKMKDSHYNMTLYDTSKIEKDKMIDILEKAINE